jgi:mRNA interferase MazF
VIRGDVITVAMAGDYGKPRPALVVQADHFNSGHPSVTILPLTSKIVDAPLFRITLDPGRSNGLTRVSQIMVDKISTVPVDKVGETIGRLSDSTMVRVGRALALWVGVA